VIEKDLFPYRPRGGWVDSQFDKYTLNLTRVQRMAFLGLGGMSSLILSGSGQWSIKRLSILEYVSLGGANLGLGRIRGHQVGGFTGDYGFSTTAEFQFAPPYISDYELFGQRIGQLMQLSLFVDYGGVYIVDPELDNAEPAQNEDSHQFLSGYGFGVRLFYKDRFSLFYDLAFPGSKEDGDASVYNYVMCTYDMF